MSIGGGSYWAWRAAARPLFGPCGPPVGLARPLLATSKHKISKVYCLMSVLNNLSAAMHTCSTPLKGTYSLPHTTIFISRSRGLTFSAVTYVMSSSSEQFQ